MKLFFKTLGEGKPLLILHGLFGSGDNWQTLARRYAEDFKVYLIDQRNHGHSPHDATHSYQAMAEDLEALVEEEDLNDFHLLGHSMGGKTAMLFASENGYMIDKLIVADMAPKSYPVHHQQILKALTTADLETLTSRSKVDAHLSQFIQEAGVKQFLLKNLYWKEKGKLAWRFNVPVLNDTIEKIVEETDQQISLADTLFIRGGKSDYIQDEDIPFLNHYFPNNQLETIPDAGHWLHAEAPETFFNVTRTYLLH
ncbi:MAG: alpha/beta fold hydrolase [Flavobacteriales bacterium]|nr:alpha/beta fold hydrolase [Flavobacteriales bacterium]